MANFYARLRERRQDDAALVSCIERVVNQLEAIATTSDRPGMLLGKIQSGKTRGFVGVIARAFDREFDFAIVLTKGTKTLSAQTVARLNQDFEEFIDEDELLVLDIMKLPGTLRRSELSRKIVIVAKKQTKNLERLLGFINEHAALQGRRALIVDDEADLASIRFIRKRGHENIEQGTIATQMDTLRERMQGVAFLQVTATPYSLYLQPRDYESESGEPYVFKPKRPSFTELLPIHSGYVGGDDYFGDFDGADPRHHLIVEVGDEEQDSLRRQDKRRINSKNALQSPNTEGLRRSIVTFVLAASIRRWQQRNAGEKQKKYAMIIHNDTQKAAHAWQDQVIDWIFDSIVSAASEPKALRPIFDAAFDDLALSVRVDGGSMPSREEAFELFADALRGDDVVRETVNSDRDVLALLDAKAELKLRTPFNIYVGGNILDRGITIPNLISFYYGRNPKTMQADTVLQHSRMYGNRDRRDLAVTRFFTSRAVYERLYTINNLENALREAFESGAHDRGVTFIQADQNKKVRPCAPNKILLSDVVAIKPNGFLLPSNFQTKSGRSMIVAQKRVDDLIDPAWHDQRSFFDIEQKTAFDIIAAIDDSLIDCDFDWNAMPALIDYYSNAREGGDGRLLVLSATDRHLDRSKSGDKSGLSILGPALRSFVADPSRSKVALILLKQVGTKELGWNGHSFWWPILAIPGNVEPCVFAGKTVA